MYRFAVTGMGLKLRSHPLAVAFANVMLKNHGDYQEVRDYCADKYEKLFNKYDFIETLNHSSTEPSWYGYIIKFDGKKAGVSREEFVDMLLAEGLKEADIPGSTGPNHKLPLFIEPHTLFPQFYNSADNFNVYDDFPNAEDFYNSIVKFPTWALPEHKRLLEYYLDGLEKVLDYVSRTNS